ncbi:MAG: hypothetical protein H7A24_09085 [Leptospiraceae bacterium]|nr:hypothetical protein [Leptospiraceae bacterium]MCP5512023.1 hypothetical protein [Leptospiraceae bacterium]
MSKVESIFEFLKFFDLSIPKNIELEYAEGIEKIISNENYLKTFLSIQKKFQAYLIQESRNYLKPLDDFQTDTEFDSVVKTWIFFFSEYLLSTYKSSPYRSSYLEKYEKSLIIYEIRILKKFIKSESVDKFWCLREVSRFSKFYPEMIEVVFLDN